MDALRRDLRHAVRMFLEAPGFTTTAMAALALGIAANTAIFSVVDTVLWKPFAYRDPGRLVMFQNTFRRAPRTGSAAPAEFNWWRRHSPAVEDVSAYSFGVVNFDPRGAGDSPAEQIPAMTVSAGFFPLSGARAVYGRTFTAADDLPHAPKTAVLAWSFFARRFAADPRAIGRRITLQGDPYEIIGVLNAGVETSQLAEQSLLTGDLELERPPDVYLPSQLDPASVNRGHSFNVAGRLKPGVTLAAANAQVQASYPEYARQFADLTPGAGFAVEGLHDAIVGGVRGSLWILAGAVGMVLLIACANVAGLQLARATGRRREIAIRAAVGASRGRIVRQVLTESVLLSLGGGVLGLAAGYAGIRALLKLSPGIPRIGAGGANVNLDWGVLGFTAGLSILTGILFGLVPALESSRANLASALKESGHRGGTGQGQSRTRALLAIGEIALAVVLSIGAALLLRSFVAIRQVNPGFEARHLLTMRVSLTGPRFADPATVAQAMHESLRRIRALPGVEAAAAACCVPMDARLQVGFRIVDRPPGPDSGGVTGWVEVSAGYFETFRIPLLRGRAFTQADESGPPVAIVNETLARRYWPGGDVLHRRIAFGDGPAMEIVGVAGDVRDRGLTRDPRANVYVPSVTPGGLLRAIPWAWAIRTRVAPQSVASAIQTELRAAVGGLPVANVRTMEEIVSRSNAAADFNTLVLSVFGGAALWLAAIGIYGLMAYSVEQRRQEIGIRLALGAEARRIRKMVVLQGLRMAAAGVAGGLAAAFGLTRLLAGFLFGVEARDPLVFVAVPAMLAAVALMAAWLPAWRAGRVDPLQALRHE